MKKALLWFIIMFGWVIWLCLPVSAQTESECNKFWWTCYVKDINVIDTDKWPQPTLIITIKRTINLILTLLATIATLICIYAWIKMLTSWWDDKWYKAWLSTLKYAAMWLAIIALSRIIISAILWFVGAAVGGNNMLTTWNNPTQWEIP